MGRSGRWIALAAVLGVLVFLIILLYLILEPLHRDDDDAMAAVGITASASSGTTSGSSTFTAHTPEPIRPAPAISRANPRRPMTISSDLAALIPHAADTTRPRREKAQATT